MSENKGISGSKRLNEEGLIKEESTIGGKEEEQQRKKDIKGDKGVGDSNPEEDESKQPEVGTGVFPPLGEARRRKIWTLLCRWRIFRHTHPSR